MLKRFAPQNQTIAKNKPNLLNYCVSKTYVISKSQFANYISSANPKAQFIG